MKYQIKQVKVRIKMIINYLNLSFSPVGKAKSSINTLEILVFQVIIQNFQISFHQIFVKIFQKATNSKFILKLDIFTIKILTQTNQFLNSLKINRILQRVIKFDFIYDGNYENYFRWILCGFDSCEKSKLDVLSYKNTKFLFYRFIIIY